MTVEEAGVMEAAVIGMVRHEVGVVDEVVVAGAAVDDGVE
jgi:hypothetical protein